MIGLSAILDRRGGVFLYAGEDGAEKYIESGESEDFNQVVGWLFWRPETVKLLEMLQPRCFIRTEEKMKPYIEISPDVWGEELMELVKNVGK